MSDDDVPDYMKSSAVWFLPGDSNSNVNTAAEPHCYDADGQPCPGVDHQENGDVLVWLRSVVADSGDRLWDAIEEIERLRAGLLEMYAPKSTVGVCRKIAGRLLRDADE